MGHTAGRVMNWPIDRRSQINSSPHSNPYHTRSSGARFRTLVAIGPDSYLAQGDIRFYIYLLSLGSSEVLAIGHLFSVEED
jgi:hypothetical protein